MRNERGHFLPGYSGNPGGRPAGKVSLSVTIEQALSEETAGKTRAEHITDILLTECESGKDRLRALTILFRVWTDVYKAEQLEDLRREVETIKERLML